MNIKQLRQTILDRAIRGQLVSQDPTDEPASVLLERIRAEKEQLIKDKKLKREKRDNQPIEEVPFEIPEGWVWCRLGEIGEIIGGGTPSTSVEEYWNGEISWITPADLSNYSNKYIACGKRNITQLGLENSSATLIPKGGILFSTRAPIGYVAIADKPLSTNQGFKNLYPFMDISKEFIYYFLLAEKERIKLFASGTTFQELSTSVFSKILISLPPLAEQHRIVQKIEQLFALVDIIEVNKKALEKLIEQAKSQVLSDAVAGKLTHQDSNDEPAEELLKRIGKTTAPDTPYEKMLPKGWTWCRLGDLTEFIRNGISIKQNKGLKGYPITRIETISEGSINRERMGYADIYDLSKYEQYLLTKGDILLSHINSPIHIGKSAVYTPISDEEKIIHGMNLLCIRLKEVDSCFINYFFNSKTFRYSLFPFIKHAVNQASINIGNLRNIYIPLPPLAEQHRIVQQIEMYFAAFDKIKNELI